MRTDDAARIRRELGLDLVEAARKAGVRAPSREPEDTTSGDRDDEATDSMDVPVMHFENPCAGLK